MRDDVNIFSKSYLDRIWIILIVLVYQMPGAL